MVSFRNGLVRYHITTVTTPTSTSRSQAGSAVDGSRMAESTRITSSTARVNRIPLMIAAATTRPAASTIPRSGKNAPAVSSAGAKITANRTTRYAAIRINPPTSRNGAISSTPTSARIDASSDALPCPATHSYADGSSLFTCPATSPNVFCLASVTFSPSDLACSASCQLSAWACSSAEPCFCAPVLSGSQNSPISHMR